MHTLLILKKARKKWTRGIGLELFLKFKDGFDSDIILLPLEEGEPVFAVDSLNSLLYLLIEIEFHGLDGKLNIRYFFEPEVNEITVVRVTNLIVIDLHFSVESQDKCCRKSLAVVLIHSYFDVS